MKLSEYIRLRCECLEEDIKATPTNDTEFLERLYGRIDELEVLQHSLESGEIDE